MEIKPLFVKESSLALRTLLAILLAVGLITADMHFNNFKSGRAVLDSLAYPIYWVANLPAAVGEWTDTHIRSRARLLEDNARLAQENLVLQGLSQQMASVQAENARLRALLNSSALVRDDVLVAELIGVSPDPERQLLVLNKGTRDGVFVGQPLIDAEGLMGQVVEVSGGTSRALLITDVTHSVPVQINRNGVRAIVEGAGEIGALEVRHVSATTDIEPGDLLVTSGLGERFPVGYPVAEVTDVERDTGEAFARVVARPRAALDRTRHVLLVFTSPAAALVPPLPEEY
ncbi:rod shape-determining protein MreC [Halioglobus sp.]|nr:rod shape-determining protein MreC [Halioglobus sp.]